MISGNQVGFRNLQATFQGQEYIPMTIWPALITISARSNKLASKCRDSDLKQIENAFKDPED